VWLLPGWVYVVCGCYRDGCTSCVVVTGMGVRRVWLLPGWVTIRGFELVCVIFTEMCRCLDVNKVQIHACKCYIFALYNI